MSRCSGILMALSSLPSNWGIGTMGKSAYEFVDFLRNAGQKYWQLLPLVPTSCGNSPYSSFSTYAGNPNYIDLDMLANGGLLKKDEIKAIDWGDSCAKTDYGKVSAGREKLLRKAFERGRERYADETAAFRRDSFWIEDYALYMAAKTYFGMKTWMEWDDRALRMREHDALCRYRELLKDEIEYHCFVQMLFYKQWNALRAYAHRNGVQFIGDIPIYVALDSADVWSEPHFFMLDGDNMPTLVAGCPPDAFSDEGQFWGNPLYDWDRMRADGYGWWIRRIDGAGKLYDVLRIDHFRGFESFWAIPADAESAKSGYWMRGPGMGLVSVLRGWFPHMRYIAEDLGMLTDGVRQLVRDSGFPGMCVLQFAFDAEGNSDYLPHNCKAGNVCYVGTHDNDTVKGWVEHSKKEDIAYAKKYMHITPDEGWCWGMIRTGMATPCELFVVPMQDVLELGGECRMNVPGVAGGNWQWRMLSGALTKKTAAKLREYTERYRRI